MYAVEHVGGGARDNAGEEDDGVLAWRGCTEDGDHAVEFGELRVRISMVVRVEIKVLRGGVRGCRLWGLLAMAGR